VAQPGEERITGLQKGIKNGLHKLRGLDVADQLGIEILSQLVGQKKTMAEIVEGIWGLRSSDPGFSSCYTKVRRATRNLESKGLVSTRLFGRDKPYRLTDLAMINLARIGGEAKQIPALPRVDLATYLATAVLSIPIILLGADWFRMSNPSIIAVFAAFFFLLGVSFSRFIQALRRVL